MAESKLRKRRFRERRQQAGMKAELVWLTPEGQAAMAAPGWPRSGAGETVDAVVNRALLTLHTLTQTGTSPVPHRQSTGSHVSGVHAGREARERGDEAWTALSIFGNGLTGAAMQQH
jgi:hypothetical protein